MRRIWVAYPLRGSQRVGSSPLVFLPFLSFLHFTLHQLSTALPPSHNSTSCSTANPSDAPPASPLLGSHACTPISLSSSSACTHGNRNSAVARIAAMPPPPPEIAR